MGICPAAAGADDTRVASERQRLRWCVSVRSGLAVRCDALHWWLCIRADRRVRALRDAVRLSRSTLHATPYEIAAAAGCDPGTVKRRLMQPTARGVCDAAAAAAAHEDPSGCRWGPRLWEMCPPSCATALGNYSTGPARTVYIGRDSGLRVHLMARTNTPLSAAFVVRSVRDPRNICAGAASKHEPIREAAARNPNCSFAALVRLADDDVAAIRGAVASNPGCPPMLLTVLASDPAPVVRSAAVANASCPEAALAAAAGDEFDVRWSLAGNPACPSQALDVIAEDSSFVLLHSVATNPNCSQQTLLRLAAWHPGAEVSDPRVARTRATDMRSFVASNPACPPQMLQQLADDPATLVRAAVAANPDIAAGALGKACRQPLRRCAGRSGRQPGVPAADDTQTGSISRRLRVRSACGLSRRRERCMPARSAVGPGPQHQPGAAARGCDKPRCDC